VTRERSAAFDHAATDQASRRLQALIALAAFALSATAAAERRVSCTTREHFVDRNRNATNFITSQFRGPFLATAARADAGSNGRLA
jgi:hypothetical protein